ncbi:hypothetical protein QYM36_009944 [Artemia franciscana]|uniref:Uncharacterized protein n=1 Tax=Artemia franciscana TaxID=6661 RepID=A0AA88HNK4_ARTSF|nr:hypothetical protein QYM36_009944 [Artemia franciscana]
MDAFVGGSVGTTPIHGGISLPASLTEGKILDNQISHFPLLTFQDPPEFTEEEIDLIRRGGGILPIPGILKPYKSLIIPLGIVASGVVVLVIVIIAGIAAAFASDLTMDCCDGPKVLFLEEEKYENYADKFKRQDSSELEDSFNTAQMTEFFLPVGTEEPTLMEFKKNCGIFECDDFLK